jgi:hypothetical protein
MIIHFLGTIIFATIVGIGWPDGAGSWSLLGPFDGVSDAGRRPRTPRGGRRGGEDQPMPPAPAL